jgi:hypothetical protein
VLEITLDRMDAAFQRATAALHCDLAYAYLTNGDRDRARAHAQEARQLAEQTHSVRQRRRVERLALAHSA